MTQTLNPINASPKSRGEAERTDVGGVAGEDVEHSGG